MERFQWTKKNERIVTDLQQVYKKISYRFSMDGHFSFLPRPSVSDRLYVLTIFFPPLSLPLHQTSLAIPYVSAISAPIFGLGSRTWTPLLPLSIHVVQVWKGTHRHLVELQSHHTSLKIQYSINDHLITSHVLTTTNF